MHTGIGTSDGSGCGAQHASSSVAVESAETQKSLGQLLKVLGVVGHGRLAEVPGVSRAEQVHGHGPLHHADHEVGLAVQDDHLPALDGQLLQHQLDVVVGHGGGQRGAAQEAVVVAVLVVDLRPGQHSVKCVDGYIGREWGGGGEWEREGEERERERERGDRGRGGERGRKRERERKRVGGGR